MSEALKVFLTGGRGFLGQHILKCCEDQGYEVRALSRTPQSDPRFRCGNLLEPSGLIDFVEEADVVIHAAGLVSHEAKDSDRVWQANFMATKNLLELLRTTKPARLIMLSTSGTIAVSEEERSHTEDSGSPAELIQRWPYYRSKHYAELEALKFLEGSATKTYILNPSLLLGPGDEHGRSHKSIHRLLDGSLPGLPGGGLSFTDVRDVAGLVATLCMKDAEEGRYLLSGCNMSFVDYYQRCGRLAEINPPLMRIPRFAHKALRWLPNGNRFLGEVSPEELELASHFWYVDDSKARDQLNWTTRDPIDTLLDAISDQRERRSRFQW